jgi:hypothetical protein
MDKSSNLVWKIPIALHFCSGLNYGTPFQYIAKIKKLKYLRTYFEEICFCTKVDGFPPLVDRLLSQEMPLEALEMGYIC